MEKRANAVTFKGKPLTAIGPQLKAGDQAPDPEVGGLGPVFVGGKGGARQATAALRAARAAS